MDIEKLYKYLPERLYPAFLSLDSKICEKVDEIRLRSDKPLSLTMGNKNMFLNSSGKISGYANALKTTKKEISECISKLTNSSMYSYDETVKKGYIPLEDGSRAGICGEAVCTDGRINSFSNINSICLRVSRFFPDIAYEVNDILRNDGLCGVLVCSPPAMGKTTFLRSAVYLLSGNKNPFRIGIVDERREIFVPQMSECLVDVVTNASKSEAMELLTRTMSPQIIVCDEISPSEEEPVSRLQNNGVCLIASCHGNSSEEIKRKEYISKMISAGVFRLCVSLYYENGYKSRIEKL